MAARRPVRLRPKSLATTRRHLVSASMLAETDEVIGRVFQTRPRHGEATKGSAAPSRSGKGHTGWGSPSKGSAFGSSEPETGIAPFPVPRFDDREHPGGIAPKQPSHRAAGAAATEAYHESDTAFLETEALAAARLQSLQKAVQIDEQDLDLQEESIDGSPSYAAPNLLELRRLETVSFGAQCLRVPSQPAKPYAGTPPPIPPLLLSKKLSQVRPSSARPAASEDATASRAGGMVTPTHFRQRGFGIGERVGGMVKKAGRWDGPVLGPGEYGMVQLMGTWRSEDFVHASHPNAVFMSHYKTQPVNWFGKPTDGKPKACSQADAMGPGYYELKSMWETSLWPSPTPSWANTKGTSFSRPTSAESIKRPKFVTNYFSTPTPSRPASAAARRPASAATNLEGGKEGGGIAHKAGAKKIAAASSGVGRPASAPAQRARLGH